jgi:DNA primase
VLANELIEYIIKNNKITIILEALNCHSIKDFTKEYRAGLPNHHSKTAISVNKETTKIQIYQSDSNVVRGNIITLCQNILNISFPEANKFLHKLLGLEYKFTTKKNKEKTEEDPLEIFKKVKSSRQHCNVNDMELIDENLLKDYIPYNHIDWIREGIMCWTSDVFKIGYSNEKKRIIIPHRLWSGGENDFVGIIGRTTIKEWEMLDIPKYFPLKSYSKSLNLYGLQENYQHIQEANYVNVVESEKSVLKRHSKNDKTLCAVCGHEIYDEQVKILIGLDVDIIIQMDQGIPLNHIRYLCEKFYNIRNVYYVFDRWDLLNSKESPADKENKVYNFLWKYKVKYDENEHKEYLKWINEKR